jgi:hypothetical protein
MAASDKVMMYRVTLKDASGRVGGTATTVVVPEGVQRPEKPARTLYRFRVRTADGTETVSPIAVGLPPAEFTISDLRWGRTDLEHGSETTMRAKVEHDGGAPLRFVVEHNQSGSWKPYATVPATVKDGIATATLRVHHPVLPPTGDEPAAPEIEAADVAQLRFTLEKGEAGTQPRAAPKGEVKATSKPPAVEASAKDEKKIFTSSELRWESNDHDHGGETTLHAKVANDDGQPVRFVVEHYTSGSWQPYATVPATVKGDHATAMLVMHHPLLPPSGDEPDSAGLKGAKPARLRFKVELGEALPQPHAPTSFTASELRWESSEHDHGDETTLHAKVSGRAGQPVRFVVEHNTSGSWEPYATVPATVRGNQATARLRVHHPVLPPTGEAPDPAELRKAKPSKLRFKAELGDAQPQPRAAIRNSRA